MTFTLVTCALAMGLVALVAYLRTRGGAGGRDGYFLAGRGLTAPVIAGSLLLTNLSAEQLIGLNGSAYGFDLSSMGWEVTAAVSTVVMALVFLPRYLALGFTTLPAFLAARFDDGVRRMTVVLFMLGYGLVTIPSVLYSGSLAVMRLFDVPGLTGLGEFPSLCLTVVLIGTVGGAYAVLGGLRAVAVSDTLNGIGLLVLGGLVPILGLAALGEGSVAAGLRIVLTEAPEKLNAVGDAAAPTPFGTLFTGMIVANLFYWGTNQYVIQRTLGAASLAEGQKGVLLSGFFKLLVPLLMMLPGVIAFHLYGPLGGEGGGGGVGGIDRAYPRLVADVLPTALTGVFLAVLLGAVFSSFNSLLNSAATLFALDVWEPLRGQRLADAEVVRVAKRASLVIALAGFVVAPLLGFADEGLWQVVRVFTGFYNVPVIAVVLMGLFAPRVPALGAKLAIGFHVVAYGLCRFALDEVIDLHFVHLYAVLFVIEVAIMLAIAAWRPAAPRALARRAPVDLTPWRHARPVAATLLAGVVLLYLVCSPLGLAAPTGLRAPFWLGVGATLLLTGLIWAGSTRRNPAARPV